MLKNKLKSHMAKHEDGFTIIEVIIVLVIGAVIMLMVFLVVPQLQRTQRNSARQNNARRILTAIEQLKANGTSSPTQAQITAITGTLSDPSGKTDGSDLVWTTNADATTASGNTKLNIYTAASSAGCNAATNSVAANTSYVTGTGSAVVVVLEPFSGTTGTGFCVTSGS